MVRLELGLEIGLVSRFQKKVFGLQWLGNKCLALQLFVSALRGLILPLLHRT